jgi:aryl-alcohol dehydrogenase-like predicted oxidoreductase
LVDPNIYSGGLAEQILGEATDTRRDDVLIGTKLRYPTREGPNDSGLSRHHILKACDASLRRLSVDYIDLLQLHETDPATPMEETLRALDDLVRAGKVRDIGVSNFAAWMIAKALAISGSRGWERFVSHQASYSLIERDIEFELVPMALDQG